MTFYLGAHQPHWLGRADVPLFVSAVTLRKVACLRQEVSEFDEWLSIARDAEIEGLWVEAVAIREEALTRRQASFIALAPWALDSGGFSELAAHGRWTISAAQYVDEVRRWSRIIGRLEWAAIQDWMCEPVMLAKTGLTVREHQVRTTASLITLRTLAPDIRWAPVLQGWRLDDYLAHLDMYQAAGFDLADEPIVGVGSVCRRQGTREAANIMRSLWMHDIRIHAFGIKTQGLRLFRDWIVSSDSMAWSFAARRLQRPGLAQCEGGGHKNCANCLPYALEWRRRLLANLPPSWGGQQESHALPAVA